MAAATATHPFPAAATNAYAAPTSFAPPSFAKCAAPPPSSSASSSFVGAVTSRLFYALGAYVGVVSALFLGSWDLFFTLGLGAASVPFIFYDAISEIYEAPIGRSHRNAGGVGGRTSGAGTQRRRGGAKKLAEPPVETMMMRGEAAGAPAGHEYGAAGRGLSD